MPEIKTEEKVKIFLASFYNVILHNDDVTTMDFVVEILSDIFDKPLDEAVKVMLDIHNNGSAVCGTYTQEIALTKQNQVLTSAKRAGFPLKCTVEKE
ncbi:MAG: ATP-dependent Clp protease adaptor ClpS [Campylobacteraceae bacterium]|nr:ATP-dependent Clp protease adaptor ClpS [Campylobacteraceae bacterium]